MDVQRLLNYIGGGYRASASGECFEKLNPATGAPLCQVELALEPEVEAAIAAAREGQREWAALTGAERGRVLMRAVALLRARNDELARLEVLDTGKPLQEAIAVDVASGADCLEYFAGMAATLHGDQYPLRNAFAYTRREPLGICVGIGAWNYPIQIALWKSAPALACGNAMIFKPSELTPNTAAKLAEIYSEAGVPAGVFQVLQGDGRTGRLLSAHPEVAKISVTGSVPTGKRVMAAAAETLKRVTMELGGKSALVVFDDADIEQAVTGALLANFYTQGEICTNGTRVFVHEAVYDAFVARVVERAGKLRLGDPLDMGTQVGALISRAHADKVLGYIASGKAEGARCVLGGSAPADAALAAGNYVLPTVFADCTDDMTIVREEIFGPVMSVLRFTDEDEVVARANGTRFGLAAGVFTRDLARGHRMAGRLEAGVCWINNYNITPIEMPFGGMKESGIGSENSHAAIEHYTRLKSVYVELGAIADPYA
ncbi:betaine-aldehyde dehydrogenase [Derxia lacustris]|uniref:betaine-aldehyde dehydrogenase n=1 Tax=Derxia lacustris TaxID=764842 RepID=UPI0015949EDC